MIRRVGMILAGVAFVASLGFDTLLLSKGDSGFLVGLACLMFGCFHVPWFANPLLLIAALSLRSKDDRGAAVTAGLSLPLALSALWIREAPFNEAGMTAEVVGYGPGFYLWIGSAATLFATSLWCALHPTAVAPPESASRASTAVPHADGI